MASSRHLKGSVLSRVRDLLKSGVLKEKPVWYDVVATFPPFVEADLTREPEPGRVKKIVYPEDVIRRKYFSKYELEPISLWEPSTKQTTYDRFVEKCQELINDGSDESKAFHETERLFADEIDMKKSSTPSLKQIKPKIKVNLKDKETIEDEYYNKDKIIL